MNDLGLSRGGCKLAVPLGQTLTSEADETHVCQGREGVPLYMVPVTPRFTQMQYRQGQAVHFVHSMGLVVAAQGRHPPSIAGVVDWKAKGQRCKCRYRSWFIRAGSCQSSMMECNAVRLPLQQ